MIEKNYIEIGIGDEGDNNSGGGVNPTSGKFPVNENGTFVDSTLEQQVGVITTPDKIIAEGGFDTVPGTVTLGDALDLEASGPQAIFRSKITGIQYQSPIQRADLSGTGATFDVPFGANTLEVRQSTNNFPLTSPLKVQTVAPINEVINNFILWTNGTIRDFRMRLTSQTTGNIIISYPDKFKYDRGEGVDLIGAGQKILALYKQEDEINPQPNTYYVDGATPTRVLKDDVFILEAEWTEDGGTAMGIQTSAMSPNSVEHNGDPISSSVIQGGGFPYYGVGEQEFTFENIAHEKDVVLQVEKGVSNGVTPLDAGNKIPIVHLPASVMEYKESYDITTNTPTLADGTGDNGDLYRCSTAGTRDFGSGNITVTPGDALIYSATLGIWQKIPSEDIIQSVNGKVGIVELTTSDIDEGGNLYFTEQRVANTPAVQTNTAKRSYPQSEEDKVALNTKVRTTAKPGNGFIDPNNTVTGAFNDTTRELTLTPVSGSYTYWTHGIEYTKNAPDSIVIDDIEGNWYIYYDGANLVKTQTFSIDIIDSYAFVAALYWDATNKKQIYFGREYRHGADMASRTHARFHSTIGFDLEPGGGNLTDMDVDALGSDITSIQFGNDITEAWDEDAYFNHSARASTAVIPIYYFEGTNLRLLETNNYPVLNSGSGRASYNQITGGSGSIVEIGSGNFVLAHVFTTNDIDRPYGCFIGQNEYLTRSDARDGAEVEIQDLFTLGIPLAEIKFLGTQIVETRDSYTNSAKSRFRSTNDGSDYVDLRTTLAGKGGSSTTQDHNNLSGLQGGQFNEYYHLTLAEYLALGEQQLVFDANNVIYEIASAGSRNGHPVINFSDSVEESVICSNKVPPKYSGGDVTVEIDWVAKTATSGSVVWGVEFERNNPNGSNIDSDSYALVQKATGATNVVSGVVNRTTISLTQAQADSIVANDSFRMRFERYPLDAGDNMVGEAQALKIVVRF